MTNKPKDPFAKSSWQEKHAIPDRFNHDLAFSKSVRDIFTAMANNQRIADQKAAS